MCTSSAVCSIEEMCTFTVLNMVEAGSTTKLTKANIRHISINRTVGTER